MSGTDPSTDAGPDRIRRVRTVLHRTLSDAVLVLPSEDGEVLRLEGAAAAVWLATEGPADRDHLIQQAVDDGGLAPQAAADLVGEAVAGLLDAGLIEPAR